MLRTTRAVYLASAAALLLGAPLHAQSKSQPAAPCDQTVKTGTFRVTVTSDKGAPTEALLLLERTEGCLEATFIADGAQASGMQLVSIIDGVVTAKLRTADGMATATLRLTETGITGDIAQGRKTWRLSGRRTA